MNYENVEWCKIFRSIKWSQKFRERNLQAESRCWPINPGQGSISWKMKIPLFPSLLKRILWAFNGTRYTLLGLGVSVVSRHPFLSTETEAKKGKESRLLSGERQMVAFVPSMCHHRGRCPQQLSFLVLAKEQRSESEAVVEQTQRLFCDRILMMLLVPPIWGEIMCRKSWREISTSEIT